MTSQPLRIVPERPLLVLEREIPLDAVPGERTADCFPRSEYASDLNIDRLPEYQPDTGPCMVRVYQTSARCALRGAVWALPGINPVENLARLGSAITDLGYPLTLPQIKVFKARGELPLGSWGNFFFIQTDNSLEPVVVGDIGSSTSRLGGKPRVTWSVISDRVNDWRPIVAGLRFYIHT